MMILEKELLASPMQCVCRLPISNSDRRYTNDEKRYTNDERKRERKSHSF